MQKITRGKGEDKTGSIPKTPVNLAWGELKTLSQIAAETGLPIEVVNRDLKEMQKALVRNGANYLKEDEA